MKPRLFLTLLAMTFGAFAKDGNVLSNADFLAARPDGKPAPLHWSLEGNCDITTSPTEGAQVKVKAVGKKDGRLTQSFDVSAQSQYVALKRVQQKVENHEHMVALHYTDDNFARIHQTLRVTPAMEAGISDHVWTLDELIALLD